MAKKNEEQESNKVLVRLARREGVFSDLTQANGKVVNRQIVEMERTERVEQFIANRVLVEVEPGSKEHKEWEAANEKELEANKIREQELATKRASKAGSGLALLTNALQTLAQNQTAPEEDAEAKKSKSAPKKEDEPGK